ncbi:MAG: prepilin peptidase, partial [Acidobacteria bacterium]|nr:prepilin peptidase [Acidobacteriota bacterium]
MTENTIFALFSLALGGVVGSFANVCIHRLPRNESIVSPPSRCPGCGKPVSPRDNVPVLGWILLRGRCRFCRMPISVRYPLVEALVALLFLAAYLLYGPTLDTVRAALLLASGVILVATDLEWRILPDEVTLGTLGLGLFVSLAADLFSRPASLSRSAFAEAALGALLGAGFLMAVRVGWERLTGFEGMGLGDVKMLGMLGALLGPMGVLLTLFLSSLAGAAVGLSITGIRLLSWRLSLARVRRDPERAPAEAESHGALVSAPGILEVSGRFFRNVPGMPESGRPLSDASGPAARRLAAAVRLARRRARFGLPTVLARLPLDDGADFFPIVAFRAEPTGRGLLV